MTLYPLQAMQYFKKDDPESATILLIAIVVIIVVSITVHIIKRNMNFGIRRHVKYRRLYSMRSLKRLTRNFALTSAELKLLEKVLRMNSVQDPVHVLNSSSTLDRHFKEAYRQIENGSAPEDEIQRQLTKLFSLRNVIDAAQHTSDRTVTANHTAVKVAHTSAHHRWSRRHEAKIACSYYLVKNEKKLFGLRKRLVVQPRRHEGSIVDVSAGGCAIKAVDAISAGSKIKLTFVHKGVAAALLAQILRVNHAGAVNIILHVRFLKIPKRAINAVNTLVYEFVKEK